MIQINNRFEVGDVVINGNVAKFRYFITAIRVISHICNVFEVSYDCRLIQEDGSLSYHIYYFPESSLSFAPSVSIDTPINELSLFNN